MAGRPIFTPSKAEPRSTELLVSSIAKHPIRLPALTASTYPEPSILSRPLRASDSDDIHQIVKADEVLSVSCVKVEAVGVSRGGNQ